MRSFRCRTSLMEIGMNLTYVYQTAALRGGLGPFAARTPAQDRPAYVQSYTTPAGIRPATAPGDLQCCAALCPHSPAATTGSIQTRGTRGGKKR